MLFKILATLASGPGIAHLTSVSYEDGMISAGSKTNEPYIVTKKQKMSGENLNVARNPSSKSLYHE